MIVLLAGLGLGCDWGEPAPPPDPGLERLQRAVTHATTGEERLAAGDAAGAEAAFAAARAEVDHPLLEAWQAQAQAAQGDLPAAAYTAKQALQREPSLAEARYNRAVWLVRLDRPGDAGPELAQALADGASTPLQVLEDPDFASVLGHPAFAFLPQDPLVVEVEAPDPVAFLDSDLSLGLRLTGLVQEPLEIAVHERAGPLQLLRVTEQRLDSEIAIRWTWRVAGAGPVRLGPFRVRAGKYETMAPAVEAEADAPPGHAPPSLPSVALPVPSQLAAGMPVPGARWHDGALVVRARPGDRLSVEPPLESVATLVVEPAEGAGALLYWLRPRPSVRRLELVSPSGQRVEVAVPRR